MPIEHLLHVQQLVMYWEDKHDIGLCPQEVNSLVGQTEIRLNFIIIKHCTMSNDGDMYMSCFFIAYFNILISMV